MELLPFVCSFLRSTQKKWICHRTSTTTTLAAPRRSAKSRGCAAPPSLPPSCAPNWTDLLHARSLVKRLFARRCKQSRPLESVARGRSAHSASTTDGSENTSARSTRNRRAAEQAPVPRVRQTEAEGTFCATVSPQPLRCIKIPVCRYNQRQRKR